MAHIYGAVAGRGWLVTRRAANPERPVGQGGGHHEERRRRQLPLRGSPGRLLYGGAPACISAASTVEIGPGFAVAADVVFGASRARE